MAQSTLRAKEDVQSFVLLSGHKIPSVGLGTWRSGSQAFDSVATAILEVTSIIIRCYFQLVIDTLIQLGVWNSRRGRAWSQGSHGCRNREEGSLHHIQAMRVRPALLNTLQELQLDLDLYLIHWPFCLKERASRRPKAGDVLNFDIEGVWREMEKLVTQNLVPRSYSHGGFGFKRRSRKGNSIRAIRRRFNGEEDKKFTLWSPRVLEM